MVVLSEIYIIIARTLLAMGNKIITTLTGAAGITGVEAVPALLPADAGQITEIGGLIVQILIGIVTLFGLFKKKKV